MEKEVNNPTTKKLIKVLDNIEKSYIEFFKIMNNIHTIEAYKDVNFAIIADGLRQNGERNDELYDIVKAIKCGV